MTSSKGEADGDSGAVSGQFTMPDLGAGAKSVTVEAEIRDDGDDKTTVKRKLQYLGPALPRPPPRPTRSQVAAPAAPQQPAPGPAPGAQPGRCEGTDDRPAQSSAGRSASAATPASAAQPSGTRQLPARAGSQKREPAAPSATQHAKAQA